MKMEQWAISKSTEEAAAFATLGMPIRIMRGIEVKRGTESTHFGIGLINVDGDQKTKTLQTAHKTGKLAAGQPWHPLLVIYAAYHARRCILDIANQGHKLSLITSGTGPATYVQSGTGLPGLTGQGNILKTGDLKLVAALTVLGIPLLHIEGPKGHRTYYLPAAGHCNGKPIDATALMTAWRADPESIPWEHPFAQAMRGMQTRERVLDAINNANIACTILQPKGPRSAVVTADAQGNVSDAAMQKVSEFFHG